MAQQTIVTMKLEGIKETVAKLKDLEAKARRRVVSAGVRAGNKVILAEARSAAPVITGALRDSLYPSMKYYSDRGRVVGSVKLGKLTKSKAKKYQATVGGGQEIPYWMWVIKGTPPHDIPGGFQSFKSRYDAAKKDGKDSVYQAMRERRAIAIGGQPLSGVLHPGSRPNPFMIKAAGRSLTSAVAAFKTAFDAKMNEEAAK